jgi:Carboxypeptidase regulatory-like domain
MGGGNLSIKVGRVYASAILFLFLTTASFSQTTAAPGLGSVEGVVLDQQGKPIPGADVYALPEEDMRRPVASTTTDSAGRFLLRDLPAARVYIYAYKESDGYPNGFAAFFALPNDQSLVVVKVEAGQTTTITIKRGARSAHLKVHITDENGNRMGAGLTLTREDQGGENYSMGTDGEISMLVPPVPFRVTVDADGYEPWHYGGANWQGKAGLITLKSGQTLSLAVRLRKK